MERSAGVDLPVDPEQITQILELGHALIRKLDGAILFCTDSLCRFYGWPREEMLGKSSHELLRTEFPAPLDAIQRELLSAGRWVGELKRTARDGRTLWVASHWALRRDSSGAETVLEINNDITESKLAQQREKCILDAVLGATDAMLVYLDPEFNFVLVNPAYADSCKMRPEEMIGKNHFALYPHPENEAIFRRVRDTGEPVFFRDKPFVYPDQPERGVTYWDWTLKPVKGPAGQIVGLVLSLRETTDRKKTEEDLRSVALFPEQNPHPVLRVRADGVLLYANRSSQPLLAEWGCSIGERVPQVVSQAVQGALEHGAARELEASAGKREYSMLITPVASSGHANLYGREVTRRKRMERALRESEQRYRTLFTSMSEGFALGEAICDENGVGIDFRFTEVNEAFERQSGLSRAIVGQPMGEVLPNLEQFWVDTYCRVALTGVPEAFEHFNRDTNRHYSVFSYSPARGKFALIFSDITQRKQEDERIREAQKLESLGLLAGGVAHDFNNLLVGVIGNASLAQDLLPPEHEAWGLMEAVVKTGEKAAHLTRQMLAYSGKGQFVLEPLDLSELIPQISSLVQPSIPKKISLDYDLAPGLPRVEADRGQIQQIFMNLALNAAEAIGSGPGSIAIRTGCLAADEFAAKPGIQPGSLTTGTYVFIEVRDNGCGMDEATKSKIFDPFYTTKFTGRGLGLAAVSGIVRNHKGAISVETKPGVGSCFTVFFPVVKTQGHRLEFEANIAGIAGSGTILVVDDELSVREMAKNSLERRGYQVLLADGGLAALDIVKRHPGEISLVLLDLNMPGLSGQETLQELRRIRPDIKVVISSEYSEPEAMKIFGAQRVSGFTQKPYTSIGLAEKVKLALSLSGRL